MKKIVFSGVVVFLSMMVNLLVAQDFNWEAIGRENLNCQVLLVNLLDNRVILAGKPGSILKTDNAGKSWRRVLAVSGKASDINALEVAKYNSNIIYAATNNGLYRSNNLGERWDRIFHGKAESENQCVAVLGISEAIFVGTQGGLFISRDNGRSWYKQPTGIASGGIHNIDIGAGKNPVIYLAAASGIFKSFNVGKTWERVFVSYSRRDSGEEVFEDGIDQPKKQTDINYVKTDRHNSNLLYFSCSRGVYRSMDQGKSWEKLIEYGLLNRDVRMIYIADNSEIFALTASGAFLYSSNRWVEQSFGLAAGKLNYFVLDDEGNIYITAEKGIYKANPKNIEHSLSPVKLEEYLKDEPDIKDLQSAAIRYAQVSSEKITQWRKEAGLKAILPQLNIGLDRNTTDLWHWEGGSTTKADDDTLRRGKDNIDWGVTLSWDFSDLIWNEAQTSIDVRSKLMVELRDDILDQVNKLYFERLRVKSELDNLALEDRNKRFDKQLKLRELAASLDALTFGYYSEQLRLLTQKKQG